VLRQHVAAGNLVHVRRGVYATSPRPEAAAGVGVDPYLLATKLQPDAVIAYHAALQFHGRAYSMWGRFHYLTAARTQRFSFRGSQFVPVRAGSASFLEDGVVEHAHAGGMARVTTLERTLVDVLDAPRYGGGWEEIWRSLEMVEFFDLDVVVALTIARGSGLTAARVGFFLEQHRELLQVEDRHLEPLRAHAPAQPLYLDRKREPGKVVHGWNLVVPERVLERRWDEHS
jgi:predicted transcriptional regulator of viral defense system